MGDSPGRPDPPVTRRASRRRDARSRPTTTLAVKPILLLALVSVLVVALVAGVRIAGSAPGPAGQPSVMSRVAPGAPPTGGPSSDHAVGIRAALGVMTDGLRRRDERRFLSSVDPGASEVVARQRALFRALLRLPLQEPEYVWAGGGARVAGQGAAGRAVDVVVEFRYRLRGWDLVPARDPLTLTFGRRDGRWLVVDDTAVTEGLAMGPFAEPWSGGRLVVEERPHVLVLGDTTRRADLRRLATNLERVTSDVRHLWPEPSWNGKVVAYAAVDERFVGEWFDDRAADGRRDDPVGDPSFEARVAGLPGGGGIGVRGRGPTRLIVTPFLVHQPDAYSLAVLRHEVTHVATDRLGRYPPAWLLEGAAEYTGFRVGGRRVDAEQTFGRHGVSTQTARAMQRDTWRPRLVHEPSEFYRGTAQEVEAAYIDSWMAALYVADRHGEAALRRLYHVAATQPASAGWEEVSTAVLRTVLDTDEAAFTAAVRRYGVELRRRFA